MSRSGLSEDCDMDAEYWLYRGQVASSIRGKRGQKLLREMVEALDALPEKRLVKNELIAEPPAFIPPNEAKPDVCALGALGLKRGVDLKAFNVEDDEHVFELAAKFDVAHQLIREIEFENDECYDNLTPESRWQRMRDWCERNIRK